MNSEFEKYAKDQLDHYEVPVDTESLWAEIAPVVKPKKDNRRMLWFFLGGLLIGSLVIGGLYQGIQKSSADEMIILESDTEIDQGALTSSKLQLSNDPMPALNERTSVVEEAIAPTIRNEEPVSLTNAHPEKLAGNIVDQESITDVKAATVDPSNTSASIQNNSTIQIASIEDSELTKSNQVSKEPQMIMRTETKLNFNNEKRESAWSQALEPFSLLAGPLVSDERFALKMDVIEAVKVRTKKIERDSDSKASFAKKRRGSFLSDLQFGLGVYGGISRSTSVLEPKNVQSSDYELLRINSEKQLETLHAGLSALLVSDEKLYLRTGLEYTRIGSLFSKSAERVEVDSVEGIVEIQINEFTGDTTEIFGYLQRTRTTRFIKKSYNYFHLLDVPIILGYNFGSEDVTIGIEAGIYANILVKNKGEVFQEDETFYDKKEDPQGWYKSNVGISPFIGCNVTYHFNENLQIHLSPGFRFPSVYSTSANPLREEHANLGVQAGVRYIFDNY